MTFGRSLITICRASLLNIEGEGVAEGDGEGDGDTVVESMLESSTVMSGGGADTCQPLGAFLGVLNSFCLSAAAVKEDLLVALLPMCLLFQPIIQTETAFACKQTV